MNRLEIAQLAAYIVNFNEGQTDADFTASDLTTAVQQAYNDEVIEMGEYGLMDHLVTTYDFTWAANAITLTLPSILQGKLLLRIADVTNNEKGDRLLFSHFGTESDIYWRDANTMQWGTTGPTSDRTLRGVFLSVAELLQTDGSIPKLIPAQFHPLIAWSAACWLKEVAEEATPVLWQMRVRNFRERLWKFLSKGKPLSEPPAIRRWQPVDGVSDDY